MCSRGVYLALGTHSAVSVGSRIILFGGGGATSSNNFTMLDFEQPSNASAFMPHRDSDSQIDMDLEDVNEEVEPRSSSSGAVEEVQVILTNSNLPSAAAAAVDNDVDNDDKTGAISRCWVHFAEVCGLARSERKKKRSASSSFADVQNRNDQPTLPTPRCSAVAVRIGRFVFIQGGWSRRTQEVGDFWVMIFHFIDCTYYLF